MGLEDLEPFEYRQIKIDSFSGQLTRLSNEKYLSRLIEEKSKVCNANQSTSKNPPNQHRRLLPLLPFEQRTRNAAVGGILHKISLEHPT